MPEVETAGDTSTDTMDMEKAVSDLGASLFKTADAPEPEADDISEPEDTQPEPIKTGPIADPKAQVTPVSEPVAKAVPKSWPKEMHEHWGKVDPKVQEYWETREKQMLDGLDQYKGDASIGRTLKEVITPYKPILQAAGLDEATAVGSLLNAHYRLTQGSQESRLAAYHQLGKNLGLVQGTSATDTAPTDPKVQALQQQIESIQSTLSASQQAEYTRMQQSVSQEVEAFASDTTAHPYFDECADHIVKLIKAGYPLQEAYDTAVMANPVTKAKEVARIQTEHEAKLKENARLSALPKKQAAGVNVRSKETRTAPTGPLGSMEETLRAKYKEITERTH